MSVGLPREQPSTRSSSVCCPLDVGVMSVSSVLLERRGSLAIEIWLVLTCHCVSQTKVTLGKNKPVTQRNIWCEVREKAFWLSPWEVCPHPIGCER